MKDIVEILIEDGKTREEIEKELIRRGDSISVYRKQIMDRAFGAAKEQQNKIPLYSADYIRKKASIGICCGKKCAEAGAKELLEVIKKEMGESVKATPIKCIDMCDKAPAGIINGEYFGRLSYVKIMKNTGKKSF